MNTPLSAFVPENLVSREMVSAVPSRASLLISIHTQAESGAYLRDSSLVYYIILTHYCYNNNSTTAIIIIAGQSTYLISYNTYFGYNMLLLLLLFSPH